MEDIQSLTHTKWECKYHIVWIPNIGKRSHQTSGRAGGLVTRHDKFLWSSSRILLRWSNTQDDLPKLL
jgi:hypothetical protein